MRISLRLAPSCLAIVRMIAEAVGLALAARYGSSTCRVRWGPAKRRQGGSEMLFLGNLFGILPLLKGRPSSYVRYLTLLLSQLLFQQRKFFRWFWSKATQLTTKKLQIQYKVKAARYTSR